MTTQSFFVPFAFLLLLGNVHGKRTFYSLEDTASTEDHDSPSDLANYVRAKDSSQDVPSAGLQVAAQIDSEADLEAAVQLPSSSRLVVPQKHSLIDTANNVTGSSEDMVVGKEQSLIDNANNVMGSSDVVDKHLSQMDEADESSDNSTILDCYNYDFKDVDKDSQATGCTFKAIRKYSWFGTMHGCKLEIELSACTASNHIHDECLTALRHHYKFLNAEKRIVCMCEKDVNDRGSRWIFNGRSGSAFVSGNKITDDSTARNCDEFFNAKVLSTSW